MEGQDTNFTSIRTSCSAAARAYQQYLRTLASDDARRLAKTEYDRLRIWAGNLGVYGDSPASADDRLANDDELRNIVIKLLSDLIHRLHRHVHRYNNESLDEQCTTSDSTSSSDVSDQQVRATGSADERLLRHIRRTLSQLFSVLALVRQPTNLSSNQKVFSHDFQSMLRDDFESLIGDFESYVDFYLRRTFRSESPNGDCTLPDKVLVRLKEAAVIRRKALLLKARHKRKLRGNVATEFATVPTQIEGTSIPESVGINPQEFSKFVEGPRSEAAHTVLSGTVPSIAAKPFKFKEVLPKAQAPPKSSKSVVLLRGKLDIPVLPKFDPYASEADCYICGLTLDRKLLQEDRWKKHVLEDIDPFVCLFECDKPDVLYKLPEEWYKHMQTHRMEWCCMMPAHRGLKFESEVDLKTHLEHAHGSKLSQAQINLLIRRGRRALPHMFDDCPLCGKSANELDPESEDQEATLKKLHRHVEGHMYELALLSIPPHPDLVAMSQSEAVNEDLDENVLSLEEYDLLEESLVSSAQQTSAQSSTSNDEETKQPTEYVWSQSQLWNAESLDDWTKVCETILVEKLRDSHESSETNFRAEFRSRLARRDQCTDNTQLMFSIAENNCTNRQIYMAVTEEAIDLVDMTISPTSTINERTVTLFCGTMKAAAETLTALEDLSVNGVKISIRPKHTASAPIEELSPAQSKRTLSLHDYNIAWICGNAEISCAMLDEEHDYPPGTEAIKETVCALGRIHDNNVIITYLPPKNDDPTSAATVVRDALRIFTGIRICLMLGIAGGIPNTERSRDIRLGDVVVGAHRDDTDVRVMHLNISRSSKEGRFEIVSKLPRPPLSILTALSNFQSLHRRGGDGMPMILSDIYQKVGSRLGGGYAYPGKGQDILRCYHNRDTQGTTTCIKCQMGIIYREPRITMRPIVHYGTIVSIDLLMKHAGTRDRLGQDFNAICVDTQLIDLTDVFPCLIIRGICSYADTFENTKWRKHADATAAAFAKNLLQIVGMIEPLSVTKADGNYQEIIQDIASRGLLSEAGRTVLRWMCYSYRPLFISELADVLRVNVKDDSTQSFWKRLRHVQEILIVCSSFITCSTVLKDAVITGHPDDIDDAHFSFENSNRLKIEFSDSSVKQHVTDTFGSKYFQRTVCHEFVIQGCTQYLREISQEPVLSDEVLETYPLANYVAEFWWQHWKAAEQGSSLLIYDLVYPFLTNPAHMLTWRRLYDIDRPYVGRELSYDVADLASPLYYAASVGSTDMVEEITTRQTVDPNAEGGYFGTPLAAASVNGHVRAVRILLKIGANANAQGGYYGNVLAAASANGHTKIVEMLIEAGADVNARGGYYDTALRAASTYGHEEVVMKLIQAGADLNARDKFQETALKAARSSRHFRLVNTLIEWGAK